MLDDLQQQAQAFFEAGDFESARKDALAVLSRFRSSLWATRMMAQALTKLGRNKEALSQFELVVSVDPLDGVAYREMLALAKLTGGASDVARYTVLLDDHWSGELGPLRPVPATISVSRLAILQARSMMWPQAVDSLRRAIQADATRIDLYLLLARSLYLMAQFNQSQAAVQALLTVAPDCLEANVLAAALARRFSSPADAAVYLDRAYACDPSGAIIAQTLFVNDASSTPTRRAIRLDGSDAGASTGERSVLGASVIGGGRRRRREVESSAPKPQPEPPVPTASTVDVAKVESAAVLGGVPQSGEPTPSNPAERIRPVADVQSDAEPASILRQPTPEPADIVEFAPTKEEEAELLSFMPEESDSKNVSLPTEPEPEQAHEAETVASRLGAETSPDVETQTAWEALASEEFVEQFAAAGGTAESEPSEEWAVIDEPGEEARTTLEPIRLESEEFEDFDAWEAATSPADVSEDSVPATAQDDLGDDEAEIAVEADLEYSTDPEFPDFEAWFKANVLDPVDTGTASPPTPSPPPGADSSTPSWRQSAEPEDRWQGGQRDTAPPRPRPVRPEARTARALPESPARDATRRWSFPTFERRRRDEPIKSKLADLAESVEREPLNNGARFDLAREMEQADPAQAVAQYSIIVHSRDPRLVKEIRERLEALLEMPERVHGLQRLLGDVCMQQGAFERAIECYSLAFDELRSRQITDKRGAA